MDRSPLIEDWVAFLHGEQILLDLNTFAFPVCALINTEFDGFFFWFLRVNIENLILLFGLMSSLFTVLCTLYH